MKQSFLPIAFSVAISLFTQMESRSQDKVPLSPAAKIIFKNIKTKLTNEEKNFFAKGVYVQTADKTRLTMDEHGEDQGSMDVEIYPADLNKDGIEEIFMRIAGTFFGQSLPDLKVYIKNINGKYVMQESVSSPRLFARASGFGGYPDLIASAYEGPGFYKSPTKFDVFRWDGKKYNVYKHNQPYLKTDRSIEEVVSPEYVKTIPANPVENNAVENKPRKMAIPAGPGFASTVKAEPINLSPFVAMLFSNVKTKLTDAEKNDFVLKTGLTAADTAKTKKGKPKTKFTIYPTDLNNDGKEEIFLCITRSPLGIPLNNYFFYAKDPSGIYQPLPGEIGQGVKVILNNKSGYPDLITGVPGLAREVWSWNGKVYRLQQTLNSSINIQYKTKDIDKASEEYTSTR